MESRFLPQVPMLRSKHITLTSRHTRIIFKCAPTNENTLFRACGGQRTTVYTYINWTKPSSVVYVPLRMPEMFLEALNG